MTKKLRIISSISGFRRAGFSFSKEATILDVADLTVEQVHQLQNEPNLVVVAFDADTAEINKDEDKMTVSKPAEKLMIQNSLTVNEITGTGANGSITKPDVEKYIEEISKETKEEGTEE